MPGLKKSGKIASEIRKLGGKTWGAVNHQWYKTGGKFFDHVNVAGPHFKEKDVKATQKDGYEVFSYNNPQGGAEDPYRFRKNFGLYLWCRGLNGGMTWAWNWGFGDSLNDFDQPFWRDHNMVYPTKTNVVQTIQAAGYMKGTNDLRYLGTLLEIIEKNPKAKTQKARAYLADLKKNHYKHLKDIDKVRDEFIEHILSLSGK